MAAKDKARKPAWPGGMQLVYGVGIGDALAAVARGEASVDDLVPLRDQARAIVAGQGDLVAALKALDSEIAKRGGGKTAAAPAIERFVAEIDGAALPKALKEEIEAAITKAATAAIARIDTKGDMVATPLSKIRSFGLGIGSSTGGVALVNRNLNLE